MRTLKKNIGWAAFLALTTVFAIWPLVSTFPQSRLETLTVVAFYIIHPFGALWMLVQVIRGEREKWPLILLAFIPYSFVWYYFDRNRKRVGSSASVPGIPSEAQRNSRSWAVAFLYASAALLGIFASSAESSLGVVASYGLAFAAVLTVFSSRKLSLWIAMVASGLLFYWFVPSGIRKLFVYPRTVFVTPVSGLLSLAILCSFTLAVLVSIVRLRKYSRGS